MAGQLVCDCPAQRRCKHIQRAEVELGFDPSVPAWALGPQKLPDIPIYTDALWNWRRHQNGVPVRITVSTPKDWPPELLEQLADMSHWWAPWGLMNVFDKDVFTPRYRERLERLGLDRMLRAFNVIVDQHPEASEGGAVQKS